MVDEFIEPGAFHFQVHTVAVGISNDHGAFAKLLHGIEEVFHMRAKTNFVLHIALKLSDGQARKVTPVIQTIPVKRATQADKTFVQLCERFFF